LFGGPKSQSVPAPRKEPPIAQFDPSLVPSCEMVYGTGEAEIEARWLENLDGHRINVIQAGQPFVWRYRVKFNTDVENPIFGMMIKTKEGIELYGVDTKFLGILRQSFRSGEIVDVRFQLSNHLAPGIYYFNCGVRVDEKKICFLSRRIDAAILRVTACQKTTAAVGVMDMEAVIDVEKYCKE
ncbi:MAG: Wzt carbohydrate-binding domain-containing protein, partial [Dissulfurimicrobium sp.]|uniref:Wzt carbohydrate-binding domain-containing protein n=1 Tax=Dissulfurimicrobium sp. TaxID=2022436 RepID=UPI0040498033